VAKRGETKRGPKRRTTAPADMQMVVQIAPYENSVRNSAPADPTDEASVNWSWIFSRGLVAPLPVSQDVVLNSKQRALRNLLHKLGHVDSEKIT
jgi:hypothetical protein